MMYNAERNILFPSAWSVTISFISLVSLFASNSELCTEVFPALLYNGGPIVFLYLDILKQISALIIEKVHILQIYSLYDYQW